MNPRRRLTCVAGCFCWALLMLVLAAGQPKLAYAAQTATADAETAEQQEAETASSEETSESPSESEDAKQSEDSAKSEEQAEQKEQTEEKKSEDEAKQNKEESEEPVETSVEEEPTMEVEEVEASPKKPQDKAEPPKEAKEEKCIIGSTATLLEKQSGLKFKARIDTGAKSCSLHVEKMDILNESTKEDVAERMEENIGKVITFVVKNGDGKSHILKRKIASYVLIKTSNAKEDGKRRYKVPLTFLWKNMEKEVLVTLNDRKHMEYPLLIGRNFLRDDFLVDVSLNSDD